MRLCTMQKQRDTNIGQMTGNDYEKNGLPPVRRPASKIRHFTSTPSVNVQLSLSRNLPGAASARYRARYQSASEKRAGISSVHCAVPLRLYPVASSVSGR
jgi:hypothetical protein